MMANERGKPFGFPHNMAFNFVPKSQFSGGSAFTHFFYQALTGSGFFLLPHDAGFFKMLAFFHFRKNAGLFYLLFEAAQGDIEIITVFV